MNVPCVSLLRYLVVSERVVTTTHVVFLHLLALHICSAKQQIKKMVASVLFYRTFSEVWRGSTNSRNSMFCGFCAE